MKALVLTLSRYVLRQGVPKGERINLSHDRAAADVKLRELISGKPTASTIADMCQQFIAYHRAHRCRLRRAGRVDSR
jgi:hypothetical protein